MTQVPRVVVVYSAMEEMRGLSDEDLDALQRVLPVELVAGGPNTAIVTKEQSPTGPYFCTLLTTGAIAAWRQATPTDIARIEERLGPIQTPVLLVFDLIDPFRSN